MNINLSKRIDTDMYIFRTHIVICKKTTTTTNQTNKQKKNKNKNIKQQEQKKPLFNDEK